MAPAYANWNNLPRTLGPTYVTRAGCADFDQPGQGTEYEEQREPQEERVIQVTEAYEWRGRTVVGRDEEKIGTLEEVYLDRQTGRPEWALVNTGLFGMKSNFVPLSDAQPAGEDVRVAFAKNQVTDAPKIDPNGELSQSEEAELYDHYGLDYSDPGSGSGLQEGDRTDSVSGDDAMTRSEEELRVGKTEREKGRVRLRKYVVTEEVQQKVPVRREKARIEREPITDEKVDEATSGPDISESEHEVVLHEEEPVVEKRAVPKERVRLGKDVDVEEQQVSEQVRKEQIEVEDD
ncbi:MAG: PRC and DUF2382 domain-containing protein [Thermoleophilaceae bacterium]|nr:PRC and DUF2382 domain-containing protein [Thermoleophilaceae bacterium]